VWRMSHSPIAVLRASHERLRSVVTPLTPDDVRRPAYPSEWSIAQVLSHLGSGAQIQELALDAAPNSVPREEYPPIWDVWNAKDPDAMVADGLAADTVLVDRIESLAGDADARYQVWAGEVDINGLAASRLFEHAVHTWDVAVAVDPSATLSPDATELILSGLGMLVGFVAKPKDFTGRVHITVTDPAAEYGLTLGESSSLSTWDGGPADATLALPAEALVRLVYGRLDADHTPAGVTVEGVALDDLRAAFPGF
jgi:uncharacterized protein (TIGR03083 family)